MFYFYHTVMENWVKLNMIAFPIFIVIASVIIN